MKHKKEKLFVVRKYVWASDAAQAIRKEKIYPVDDCWMDDDFKKNISDPKNEIGFKK